MADILEKYTLDQVVNEALFTLPEEQQNEMQKRRFFSFAIQGIRELRLLDTRDGYRKVKISPNALNRYDYPDDLAEFVGLGVPVNGKIWLLTRDDKIIPTTTTVDGEPTLDSDYGEGVSLPTTQFDSFYSPGGVNLEGYYTLDDRERTIIINANRQTDLILFYISSGIRKGTTTFILAKHLPALIAFILWKDVLYDRTVSNNNKLLLADNYNKERRKIKAIEKPSHQEILDAWAYGNTLL